MGAQAKNGLLQQAARAVYRLPFNADDTWQRGANGNWDDPGTEGHGKGQAYAYDFGHGEGGEVRAARAGKVIRMESSVRINSWELTPEDPLIQKFGAGNFVWVEHADGTFAAYLHLQKDGTG